MPVEAETFFSRLRPEAERLTQLIGAGSNAVPVFQAQWAVESAYGGTLPGFNWIGHENYSGLTDGGPPNFRKFASVEEHTRAQAAALQDPDYAPNYAPFLQAARENQSPTLLARLLGLSGWDANQYRGDSDLPGQALIDVIERDNLQPASLPASSTAGMTGFPPPFLPVLPKLGQAHQQDKPASAEVKQAEEKQTLTVAITGLFGSLKQTVFSWDWWKRALWLLILLILAVLLIYFSLRGMTNLQAASQGEGD